MSVRVDSKPEPVAVVGIGCRLPGDTTTPDAFWDLLRRGVNTTSDIPDDRWEPYAELGAEAASVLRDTVRRGSFLRDMDGFDADFFGLSPREAELMDPQQRILLEVAWEALEHAGVPPRSLAGSETGVFVGSCTDDYRRQLLEDVAHMDAWSGIGAARCGVANRISHVLDLRGPSLAVDTACSASLVALHLACQSLRSAETGLALVAGVNLLISPGETVTLNLAGALAADGRSKAFDATADGYGRGEGCGVLVLKLLADAQRDGDRVLAVVRGSAVSQDGHTNGIMAPNGDAQRQVMESACRHAGVDPRTVGFVEAHGTGTLVGDPLEAAALSAVYGADRADDGCYIGSVKTNIGHLEGAAGVVSVIKAVLALWHAEIPASLLVSEPNPAIPWQDNGLRIATEHVAWPADGRPRRASVSGFGYGGTIGHIVLEQAPARPPARPDGPPRDRLFTVSAASEEALRRRARELADWLTRTGEISLDSLGHSLAVRRSHLGYRAAIVASDAAELSEKLRAFAEDEDEDAVATPVDGGLVLVFSGHGSQWIGMGRGLLATEPAFAAVLDELVPVFTEELGRTPRQVLLDGDLDDVVLIQAMIFAMQVGLAGVLRARGVVPAAVIGHSVGEIAAAVTAGVLDLAEGARLSCRRSKLLAREAGLGAMAMVGLPFAEVEKRLADRAGLVAAIQSSPVSTVVSGEPAVLDAVAEQWRAEGITVRRVASDVAFHSPRMDPLAAELSNAVSCLRPKQPQIPMYSTTLPGVPGCDAAYWAANLRNPVRLADAVTAAAGDGHRLFLEVSPHPVVTHSISETLSELGLADVFVDGTLRREESERQRLLSALGALYCHGVEIDWAGLYPAGTLVDIPANPWRHRSLWWRPKLGGDPAPRHDPASRTLLGGESTIAGSPLRVWQSTLDDNSRPYPGSHSINGVEIVPAAVFVTSFFEAVGSLALRGITMTSPLMTAERRHVQVIRDGDSVRLASRGAEAEWVTHAEASVAAPPRDLTGGPVVSAELDSVVTSLVHDRLSAVGVPSTGFDWTVVDLRRGHGELRGKVVFPAGSTTWAPLLDAVMTLAPVTYPGDPVLRMVVAADELAVLGEPPASAVIDIAVRAGRPDVVDVKATGPDGTVLARVDGLRYAVIGAVADDRPQVHELAWRPVTLVAAPSSDRPLIVVGAWDTVADQVVALARTRGRDARLLTDATQLADFDGSDILLVLPEAVTWKAAEAQLESLSGLAAGDSARLWCLTNGTGRSPAGAAVAGFARTISAGVIEVDGRAEPATAELVLDLIGSDSGEGRVAVRDGRPLAARLTGLSGPPGQPSTRCRPGSTYLVAGGPTPLGLAAAERLAGLGARRILFTVPEPFPSRGEWETSVDDQVAGVLALEARGITVRVVVAVSDATALADPDRLGLPAIRGVVCLPDALPLWSVHELFPLGSLDFLVFFSSGEQALGLPGSPDSALADALAAHRSGRGEHTLNVGLVPGKEISPADAVSAWDAADRRGLASCLVLRSGVLDCSLPILGAEPDEPEAHEEQPSVLDPLVLLEKLTEEVRAQIAKEMRLEPADLTVSRPLTEQGLDSILTAMVQRRLEKRFECKLPVTLLWRTPTVVAIAEHLADLLSTSSGR
ncbi:beta-ketoacyl synthase N-terminal-like domain-containing protein [Amycolatopsis sp. cg5]|uniref:type I polyketide synthase n=1 Tax=Amycolatopsis sp. cg5 TaxID=3238802 RepID=UPI0035236EAC